MARKVGIMGGTFDPIHHGHLILGTLAAEQFLLDQVLFMPSSQPPHKTGKQVSPAEHRLKMTELAIQDDPRFIASDLELERTGYTYTSDTLAILRENEPETEFFFLMGADSLMAVETWHEPATILRLAHILVAGRDGSNREMLEKKAQELKEKYQAEIGFIEMPQIDISSTELRKRVSEKKSLRYFLPETVEEYIRKKKLYQNISD